MARLSPLTGWRARQAAFKRAVRLPRFWAHVSLLVAMLLLAKSGALAIYEWMLEPHAPWTELTRGVLLILASYGAHRLRSLIP
jgi:hypothetical protein